MALTVDDVLTRRTRIRLFDRRGAIAAAPLVAALMAPELGWDSAERERQVQSFLASCTAENTAAHTPETDPAGATP
jgi:glycerol-3-phosphate dehydrogenase